MKRYTLKNRFVILALGIVTVILLGNIGYILVKTYEGGSPTLIDAMYWTIVTLATLGSYPPGMTFLSTYGKILTIITVLGGIITIFIGLQIVAGPWIEYTLKRALKKRKQPLPEKGHVIICGYSELGKEVIRNIKSYNIDCVVVTKVEREYQELMKSNLPYIKGDPTKTKILKKSRIDKALSLVAVSDDSTNAFICLTAKKENPDIRIVSSVDEPRHKSILKRAGADYIVSSKSITGAMVGTKVVGDSFIGIEESDEEFIDGLKIKHFTINDSSKLVEKTIKEAKIGSKTGSAIVGIWKNGVLHVSVSPTDRLEKRDIVLALGSNKELERLERYIS